MRALATGVAYFEVCLFLVTDCQPLFQAVILNCWILFVCLFLFLLRGLLFFFKISENAFDGNGPSLMKKSHSSTLFSIHKIISLFCLNP